MPIHRSRTTKPLNRSHAQRSGASIPNPPAYGSVTVTIAFTTADFNRIRKAADAVNQPPESFIKGAAFGLANKICRANEAAGRVIRPDTYQR